MRGGEVWHLSNRVDRMEMQVKATSLRTYGPPLRPLAGSPCGLGQR